MIRWITVSFLTLFVLQLASLAEASHFRHGSIAWKPANNYSNKIHFTFRLAFRRSFSSSYYCDQSTISSGSLIGSGGSWTAKCVNSQCNLGHIADTGFHCTDYSIAEDWSMGENNFTYTFSSSYQEWIISYTSCCWISLSRNGNGNWLVTATVNLTRRSDNGEINSSPISRSPAIVRWQEGCPQSLRIPVEDPDGDVVRCRWATYSESSFNSGSFPYGTLDERTCVLAYDGSSGTAGTYAVPLTLEDFPTGTTNFGSATPFSAVGLQFLVIISSHYGSCYNVPVFTASTPNDGECSEVQIGLAYIAVIEVTLADFSKHIVEIVTSSPSGMQLTSLRYHGGIYYRNVTWYPNQYQVGQQLFCFKAVDSKNLESEWRCVTILVGISSTPRVIMGSQSPRNPISKSGPGFVWWSIQFDRVIKKPRTSSYIRLILLPSGHTVFKVDTLSLHVRISSNHTTLQFAMPDAALSMNGSYAILIDHGAVVGQGCSYDGPPTPGITSKSDWHFSVDGVCNVGFYLAPPGFTNCVDINECSSHSRSKRNSFYSWWNYTASSSTQWNTYGITPTTSSSVPFKATPEMTPSASASSSMPLSVPDPVAFFPLNGSYGTREIYNRVSEGIANGVYLAPGPKGHHNGSYKFSGTSNSYIEFPNSAGGVLDVRYSLTLLCWVYYDGQDGPLINYNTGVSGRWGVYMWAFLGQLHAQFIRRDYGFYFQYMYSGVYLAGGWKFVGVSYNNVSGEEKLWLDGVVVDTYNIGAGRELATQDSIRTGSRVNDGRDFRGRITQMRFYNVALTQEQIQEIQGISWAMPASSSPPASGKIPTTSSFYLPFTTSISASYATLPSSSMSPSPGIADACFNNAVGVADPGIIPDFQIIAYSYHSSNYYPHYGRLNGTRGYGWCSATCCNNQTWLQVDLGRKFEICGVATQGYRGDNYWVIEFKLSYSSDGNVWSTYLDTDSTEKHFHRKGNSSIVDQHSLPVSISARYIRFHPTNQYRWNCLRVEVYGTALEPTTPVATESTIADITPTTSSSYVPFSVLYPGNCSRHIHLHYSYHGEYIRSPGYPNCYPNNKDCTWLIEVPAGYYVGLAVYPFNLEYGGSNCPYDYLETYDGRTSLSPLITRACGSFYYMDIYSSGRFLLLRFHSNGVTEMPGFEAYCYASPGRYNNNIPSKQLAMTSSAFCRASSTLSESISARPSGATASYVSTSGQRTSSDITPTTSSSYVPFSVLYPGSCSRHINLPYRYYHYYFKSPDYPSCYPDNKDCMWLIEAPAGNYIELYLYTFNLEYGGSNCPYDYLEIYDGRTSSSPLITRLCGSLPYTYMYSSGRFLFVRFRSDGSVRMPGFAAGCYATPGRYVNYIPSHQHSMTSSAYCGTPNTQSVSSSQISPTKSSSMSSSYYAQSSSYVLPAPLDFQFHLPADCAHVCTNTPGSYSCSCVSGYRLASDGKSCLDINECSTNNGGCSHHCYNIPGSFYCGCPEGTTMAANNLTCVEPGVTVTCGKDNMTISLEKQTFPFFEVSNLHLRYSSCKATQNSTHLLISTPLNACGTLVNETEDSLIFWNEIRVDAVIIDNVITRTHDIKFPFSCRYSRREILSLSFTPRSIIIGHEEGYGNFTFKMEFYRSAAYTSPYTDSDYPIEVSLNGYIYVQYSVESSADLVIMAENCKATKDGSFYSWPQYSIIQNGCPRDTTLDYSYDPTRSFQQFKIRAFRFFNDYDTVYFHCEVLACYQNSANSRCQRSCINSKKRKRREVTRDKLEHEESTTKRVLTGGPMMIGKKEETEDAGQSEKQAALIGGAAGAGAVGLIAIIALAVLFVKYRIARRFMNRNKVGDLYTTQDQEMSRRNAYIQEDDMIEKDDNF